MDKAQTQNQTKGDVRKKKIMEFLESKEYNPMTPDDIAFLLGVPQVDRPLFDKIINELSTEGYVIISKKGKLLPPGELNMIRGVFTGHARGFGFVTPEDNGPDIFIPPHSASGARHKDVVLCHILTQEKEGNRREGEIVRIISRGVENVVGLYNEKKGHGVVVPDEEKLNEEIYVEKRNTKGAVSGHKVVCRITKTTPAGPEGEIKEILGHVNDPGTDILSIVAKHEIPWVFPAKVLREAEEAPAVVSHEEIGGRRDFRGDMVITIDGEDAKDLDDAVSVSINAEGHYVLSVHIADVSHYVPVKSATAKESVRRGTSVYLCDRVIPMLPQTLSNGICSLNPSEDRLTLSCIMEIDKSGDICAHEICQSVIHSKKRCTYEAVNDILVHPHSPWEEEYREIIPMLKEMETLAAILRSRRIARGSIEFEFAECKVIVNEKCQPVGIQPRRRNIATSIIEEFMLAANETVAEDFFWQGVPFVYRSHEEPGAEKITELAEFASKFGYAIKGGKALRASIQKMLLEAENTPESPLINRITLRSLKQARYTPENGGHFALAAKYYCHFTSPIRRLPDLTIHRVIKEVLNGGLRGEAAEKWKAATEELCPVCSATERRGEACEKEVESLKKAQYMAKFCGEVFNGVISGITPWGIYVELPNTVEGMVSVNDIYGDDYILDEKNYRYVGKYTGKVRRLGDKVKVVLLRADKETGKIDFRFSD